MALIKYIGDTTHTNKYGCSSFNEFVIWFKEQKIMGHDVETPVVQSILDRELRVIQYSDVEEKIIWVIQWSFLSDVEQNIIIALMNTSTATFLIFTDFEYTIWLRYGVKIRKMEDLYIGEKVLHCGHTVEKGFYSLRGVYFRRFEMDISKAMQTEFDDDIMNDEKIEYAAIDTLKLGKISTLQKSKAYALDEMLGYVKKGKNKGVRKTLWWENEFSKVLGDMEVNGINFDPIQWTNNYWKAVPIVDDNREKLNTTLIDSVPLSKLKADKFYVDKDTMEPVWNSAQKKKLVLSLAFSNLEGTSKQALKEFLRDNDPDFPEGLKLNGKAWERSEYRISCDTLYAVIKFLLLRNKENQDSIDEELNKAFINSYRDELIEHNLMTPAKSITINWASPVQRLIAFQYVAPSVENTNAQTVEDNMLTHKLFPIFKAFNEANSLTTKFGLKYLEHVDSDGRIRTRFDPVLSTGRIASSKPNLLQLPQIQDYRTAFIATPGWKIVGADYSSEEILIIAILSGDPNWLDAFRKGYDVHSVNASLIYGKEWDNAAEPDCRFMREKKKCSCAKHENMRKHSKTVSFGLAYGLSAHGLAVRLQITKTEAQDLIHRFFKAFPKIKDRLERFGNFGVAKGYIVEPVFGRPRFYDKWKMSIINMLKSYELGNYAMSGTERQEAVKQRGSIERESKNMPIQSAGAAVLKIAAVLLRRFINNNNLNDKVRLLLPVHDEFVTEAKEDYAEEWSKILQHYMELAGKLALKTDLLKAEPYIANHWKK